MGVGDVPVRRLWAEVSLRRDGRIGCHVVGRTKLERVGWHVGPLHPVWIHIQRHVEAIQPRGATIRKFIPRRAERSMVAFGTDRVQLA